MKTRLSHVTNSSSSSFIISRNDVTKEKLIEILLEIANEEYYKNWEEKNVYNLEEDVKKIFDECDYKNKTEVAGRYIIEEATILNPHINYYEKEYNNHFIIDNDSCGRYDWNVIDYVLSKYGISWRKGYCD